MTALRQRRIRLAHQRNRMACTKLSQSLALLAEESSVSVISQSMQADFSGVNLRPPVDQAVTSE
jgi:hypothetical protein